MRSASLIEKRSALPTSAAATSSFVGFWEDSSQGDDPDQYNGYQGLKKREHPRGSPRFHASRSQGSLKFARQWLLYALFLLSSALLFMTIWPDLVSYAQPPVAAAGASGVPAVVTTMSAATEPFPVIESDGMPLR